MEHTVEAVMTSQVVTARPSTPFQELVRLLESARACPVQATNRREAADLEVPWAACSALAPTLQRTRMPTSASREATTRRRNPEPVTTASKLLAITTAPSAAPGPNRRCRWAHPGRT
jgi:hypothetical protein